MGSLKPTIVVSGFARSGTTTMMRILEAGGIPVLADDQSKRRLNVHHPTGTYEIRDIGTYLMESEPRDTAGRAIKLVTQYMEWLPMDRPVRVIYMVRNVHEIVASLLAQKVIWEDDPVTAIGRGRKILADHGVPQLDIQYHDMTHYPRATVSRVAEFVSPGLGVDLDEDAMAKVIDPAARQKSYEEEGRAPELIGFRFDPAKVKALGGKR